MKVFITGGAGYIGSHLARDLSDQSYDIQIIDNFSTGRDHLFSKDFEITNLDLSSSSAPNVLKKLFGKSEENDVVIHLAAKKSVLESEENPDLYWKNNYEGTKNLMGAVADSKIRRFLFASTAAVYGDESGIVTENSAVKPMSVYAKIKFAEEKVIISISEKFGIDSTIFRFFNVAGSGYPDLVEKTGDNLIPKIITSYTEGIPINIFGSDYDTPDGTCVRDYVHVSDITFAHILILKSGFLPGVKVYNLGSGKGTSVLNVINAFEEFITIKKTFLGRRKGDPAILLTKNQKANIDLGWAPKYGLKEIISSVLES